MKKDNLKMQVAAIDSFRPRTMLDLDEKMLPEIKDWKLGEKYDILVTVEMVSTRLDSMTDGKEERQRASFEVTKAKAQ